MPNKDPEAYRAYMREYMTARRATLAADLAARRKSMAAVGMGSESGRELVDGRDMPDTREYRLTLPASSPYWE